MSCSYGNVQECVNADSWINDGDGGYYTISDNCLWCEGYRNITDVDKCVQDFDYCNNKSLCKSYQFLGSLDCERGEVFGTMFILGIGIGYACINCFFASQYRHLSIVSIFLRTEAMIFLGVSIWVVASGFSQLSSDIWSVLLLIVVFGPLLLAILCLIIPIVEVYLKEIWKFSMSPVGKLGLASLVLFIFISLGVGIVLTIVEFCVRHNIISTATKSSIIILGFDWAMLAFEYQTPASCLWLIGCWYWIQCADNHNVHPSENTATFEQKQECKMEVSANDMDEQKYVILDDRESTGAGRSELRPVPLSVPLVQSSINAGNNTVHSNEASIKLLIGQLILFVIYEATLIVLAWQMEDWEPCIMNWATVGPVLFGIVQRWRAKTDTKCCRYLSGVMALSMIGFSVVSCSCNDEYVDCHNLHVIVICIVSLWSLITFCSHSVHLYKKTSERVRSNN
eukprot:121186_1